VESASGVEFFSADLPRTQAVAFSPRDKVLVTFEPYAIYGAKTTANGEQRQPEPNLRFWSLTEGGKLMSTVIAQKQQCWRPQWTEDESTMLRLTGSELLIYRNNQFGGLSC
jgi:uncharacterized protein with WD repeat